VNGYRMDSLLPKEEKRGINKTFLVAIAIAIVVIGGLILLLSRRPPVDDQMAQLVASAYHEGTPQFTELSKDIIISTDDRTVQSPTGLGTISMYIYGKIRNKGDKTIDILEINVAVITQFNQVLKEKRILVVPVQQATLDPGQTIPVTLALEGFSKDDDRANIRWKVTAIRATSK
jgi:hypothetical protein